VELESANVLVSSFWILRNVVVDKSNHFLVLVCGGEKIYLHLSVGIVNVENKIKHPEKSKMEQQSIHLP
jgi:hypothetical protein